MDRARQEAADEDHLSLRRPARGTLRRPHRRGLTLSAGHDRRKTTVMTLVRGSTASTEVDATANPLRGLLANRARWSWASSTSRRIRFPTAAVSRSAVAIAHAPPHGRGGRRHSRYRRGIHPSLRRRQALYRSTRRCARLEPVLPAVVALGVPVSIDTMKAAGRGLGARRRRRHRQRRLGPAARPPTWRAWSPSMRAPVIVMHNRDTADPAIDIMADIAAFFDRSLDDRRRAPASRATASCSIPASASARRRSRA